VRLGLGESEGVRVSDDFINISKMVVGYCGLAGWTLFTTSAEIQCSPRLMIYRGSFVTMPVSVNIY
jgi:hypothetical protein